MSKSYQLNSYIKNTKHKGRGVFASKGFKKEETIESSPLIVLAREDYKRILGTLLECYVYEFGKDEAAIGLGHASLYNHSKRPNAEFVINKKDKTVTIRTVAEIKQGQEILIDYGYDLI
jgi:SET domain-containing protein